MIKGLMTEEQARRLFDKFTTIKLFHRRTNKQFPVGEDSLSISQLLELDIDFEIYDDILEESGNILILINHSQGLMVTEYNVENEEVDGNVGEQMLTQVMQYIAKPGGFVSEAKCVVVNNLGASLDDYPYSKRIKDIFGPIVVTQSRRPDNESLYESKDPKDRDVESFFKATGLNLAIKRVGQTILHVKDSHKVRMLRILSVSKGSNPFGVKFDYDIYFNTGKYIKEMSNDDFSTQRIGSTSYTDKFKIIKTIDLGLETFDFTPYISKEAIPLFIKWVRKTVKKRLNLSEQPKEAIVHRLHTSKIDGKYSGLIGQVLNQPLPSKSYLNKLFIKFGVSELDLDSISMHEYLEHFFDITSKKYQLYNPALIYRPSDKNSALGSNIIEGLKSFRDTVLKYKPLPVEFFTSPKFKEGRSNFFTTIRARINIALGTRTTLSGKQMITGGRKVEDSRILGQPRPKEGLGFKKLFKDMKVLPPLIETSVNLANKKGYDALTSEEKSQMANSYEQWAVGQFGRGVSNIYIEPKTPDIITNLGKVAGILPRYMRRAEHLTIFIAKYGEEGIREHLIKQRVFIVNYESKEIYVVNMGRYDDARYFTVSFQDYDIRMDLINAIHRVERKPEAGPVIDSNYNLNQTPQNRSLENPTNLNSAYLNDDNHVFTLDVKRDSLTGNVSGYTIFREIKYKTYMIFPFDNFFHDKEGHGMDKLDVCFTPITSPLGRDFASNLKKLIKGKMSLGEYLQTEELREIGARAAKEIDQFLSRIDNRYFKTIHYLMWTRFLKTNPSSGDVSISELQKIFKNIFIESIAQHEPISNGTAYCITVGSKHQIGVDNLMMFGFGRGGPNNYPFNLNALARIEPGMRTRDDDDYGIGLVSLLTGESQEEVIKIMNEEYGKNFKKSPPPASKLARRVQGM